MPQGLQTELKQTKPFPSRATEALLSILRTAAILDHQLGEALRPHRITATQYNVLRILRGAGAAGLCGREIAERMVARVPDVPRMLERLAARQLIRRERDAGDRRHVTARIAPRGLALLAAVGPATDTVVRARLGRLSDRTLGHLIDGLAAVRDGA
jgi:MarR family transcriptional regulator, organic hydroperoxide resistance regulator